MERSLLWGAFAIGCAGWLAAVFLSRGATESDRRNPLARSHIIAAVALILLVHLGTMPSSPPFARGHGLGIGFLLGGAAALIAAITLAQSSFRHPLSTAAVRSAAYFLAIPAVVIPLLFLRSNIIDALLGVALGSVSITTLLALLSHDRTTSRPFDLLPGAAFTATLSATAALGIYRGATIYSEWKWGATAALLAAGVPFLMLLSALPNQALAALALKLPLAGLLARNSGAVLTTDQTREAGVKLLRVILSGAFFLGLAYLISRKLVMQPAVVYVVITGIVAALAADWLVDDASPAETPNTQGPMQNAILAVLVLLAAIMVSYQMLAGFGVGLAVLSAWLAGGIAAGSDDAEAEPAEPSPLLASTLCFGTVFVVYRLAVERFREDLRGVPMTDHYALFGFVFGLLVPLLLTRIAAVDCGLGASILKAGIVGMLALAAPAGIVLVWGQKTLLTFLFGLALAASPAVGGFGRSGVQAFRNQALISLFALGLALAVAQWTHFALPLAALPRVEKLRILAWAVGIIVALLIGSGFVSRRTARRNPAAEGI